MNENSIKSVTNEKIKNIKKLYDKKYRKQNNQYIIEGIKIIEEAYIQKQIFTYIVICEEIFNNVNIDKTVIQNAINVNMQKVIYVDENVFRTISDTKTPQGILAVLSSGLKKSISIPKLKDTNVLFLDNIQDAGNMGTILRSARAFGFNNIVLNKGCTDIYNPKTIRASMGNIFQLNIVELEEIGINILKDFKNNDYTIYATTLKDSVEIYDVTVYNDKRVLVVGNEANGIQNEILEMSDVNISIPMQNNTESLNVAVATSIVMAEMQRRKIT